MAFEAVAFAVKLGRAGLHRLSKNEECMIVMEYGLSFFLDEDKVEGAFNLLDSNAEIVAAISRVSAKVDLLLDEASTRGAIQYSPENCPENYPENCPEKCPENPFKNYS